MPERGLRVDTCGEELVLLPERAVFWPRTETLLVADAHFGKAASFRAAGVPVPHGTTADALTRVDALLDRTSARRVVFLGDFLHAKEGRSPNTVRALAEWRSRCHAIAMTLVRGNHDRRAGDPPAEIAIDCVDAPLREEPFAFTHHPRAVPGAYVLAGHLHPAAVMTGPARQRERLPCFWLGAEIGVLPAFGDFTGVAEVSPAAGDRVFVIADESVFEVR
ncbi:MAG TPA: ligase-associated DNA damage response endonuclease PdeM [Gemmatimonadaceae bacterium]|nr:ligase-associated DNA damage response endonuclease PdeM [Gemmatimonadaceae bacterium]